MEGKCTAAGDLPASVQVEKAATKCSLAITSDLNGGWKHESVHGCSGEAAECSTLCSPLPPPHHDRNFSFFTRIKLGEAKLSWNSPSIKCPSSSFFFPFFFFFTFLHCLPDHLTIVSLFSSPPRISHCLSLLVNRTESGPGRGGLHHHVGEGESYRLLQAVHDPGDQHLVQSSTGEAVIWGPHAFRPTDLVSAFISPCFCAAFKAGEVTEKTTGASACRADLQRQSPTLCNISSPAAVGVRGSIAATMLRLALNRRGSI